MPETSAVPPKPLYSRQEFEDLRRTNAKAMAADEALQGDAMELFARADRYYWVHQTNWFGEPILNLPQDMFAMQEIIFQTRPDYIVEVGAAWGGSLLFYSTLMEVLGGRGVIAVDIYIPPDLKERIGRFGRLSDRIRWVEGSSVAAETLTRVGEMVGPNAKVLVVLDSDHTHDHVLAELRAYAPFVREGQYLVCSDGVIERIPPNPDRPRSWGPGNNPLTALRVFLKENPGFEVDSGLESKLLLTCNPQGYLRRVSAQTDPPRAMQ